MMGKGMTRDAELYHCAIGRIRFKRHSAREKRKDAKAIMRAQETMKKLLSDELERARYERRVSTLFAGLGGGKRA